ncbi:branched chain amino acid exporter [Streptococcus infantis SK1302]|uniref:Branched chain amino acid exporter n=2 Tax=Streptococcus TaxID=1301 RepID=A0ABN0B5I2_9STRE|nr:branched chain amino acid exporter [Streptococcus infantis SK1302]
MPVFFCSGQSANFFLLFDCVIIVLIVTVDKQSIAETLVRSFMKEKGFWEGVQAAVPTALGYVSIGLACGIIGSPYVTPVEMGLMSLFVYAGSAQFAMIALIAVQAPVAAIAMTVFLINLRLFLLSLHASTYFRHTSLWQNIGMSSLLTDETYGVLMGELVHTDKVNPMWMHGNNLNSYVAWFVGTVVGTALGGLLPNPEIFGLDFALVGMFIGIFTSQFQIMQNGFLCAISS